MQHPQPSLEEAVDAVRQQLPADFAPSIALTLGTGLSCTHLRGQVVGQLTLADLPHFPAPQVAGHPGQLMALDWHGRHVLAFQGRIHWFEGRGWSAVSAAVRLAAALGVRTAIFTNASGSLRSDFPASTLVCIDDHINMFGSNPLVGERDGEGQPPFIDLSDAYCPTLRRTWDEVAAAQGETMQHGVYAALSGPAFETPAEIRALRVLGADLVGMSTVGEVIVARWLGLRCTAISCVTNLAAGMGATPLTHEENLRTGQIAATRLAALLDGFIARL